MWVTNEVSHTINVLHSSSCRNLKKIGFVKGSMPYGIIYSNINDKIYLTLQGTGELIELSKKGEILRTLKLSKNIRDITISNDHKTIYVSQFISNSDEGKIFEINIKDLKVSKIITLDYIDELDTAVSGSGIPNYLGPLKISPNGKFALIPSKKDNVYRGKEINNISLTFENTVRSIISRIDLVKKKDIPLMRNDLNDRSLPRDVEFSPFGDIYFVVSQSSNLIDVYETKDNKFITSFYVGDAPDTILINNNGTRLYVRNFLSRDIYIYDILDLIQGKSNDVEYLNKVSTIKKEKLEYKILLGKKIFYNANDVSMAQDGYLSCASCHIDGTHDGQNWAIGEIGPRNTISLTGIGYLVPKYFNWNANIDEIQDFENEIRSFFIGDGFMKENDFLKTKELLGRPKTGLSKELDALSAYVLSLKEPLRTPLQNN